MKDGADRAGDELSMKAGLICLGMIVMHHFGCSACLPFYRKKSGNLKRLNTFFETIEVMVGSKKRWNSSRVKRKKRNKEKTMRV